MTTAELKTELRKLVAADQLETATDRLLTATAGDGYGDYRKEVVHQSGRLEYWKKQQRLGTHDYADLARTRSQVSLSLLDLVDELPDEAELSNYSEPKGVSEDQLKKQLLLLLLTVKGLIIYFAYLLWRTGSGFSTDYLSATISLLVPISVTSLVLMLRDATHQRHLLELSDKRVSSNFSYTAYGLVLCYGIAITVILIFRGHGDINFIQMNLLLMVAESILGGYLGMVIFELYKK